MNEARRSDCIGTARKPGFPVDCSQLNRIEPLLTRDGSRKYDAATKTGIRHGRNDDRTGCIRRLLSQGAREAQGLGYTTPSTF